MSGVKKLLSSSGASQSQAEQNVDSLFNVTSYTNYALDSAYNYSTGGHLINTYDVGQHKRLETGVDLRGSSTLETDQYWASTRYTGSGYPREFDIGIDLANNDSMTWIRGFLGTTGANEMRGGMFDSVRGASKFWQLNNALSERQPNNDPNWFQYTTNGFRIGISEGYGTHSTAAACFNTRGVEYMAWTWRVKQHFFDIVTYTGDGTLNRQIAHGLGSQPLFMFIKNLDDNKDAVHWNIGNANTAMSTWPGSMNVNAKFGRYPVCTGGGSADAYVNLGNGSTGGQITLPTTTHFTVGDASNQTGSFGTAQESLTNGNGKNYVAYLWGSDDSSSSIQKIRSTGFSSLGYTYDSTPQFMWFVPTGPATNTSSYGRSSSILDKKMGMTQATRYIQGAENMENGKVTYHGNTVKMVSFVDRNQFGAGLGTDGGITYAVTSSNPIGGASGELLCSINVLDPKNTYENPNDNAGLVFISNRRRHNHLGTTLPPGSNSLVNTGSFRWNDTRIFSTLDVRRSSSVSEYCATSNSRSFTSEDNNVSTISTSHGSNGAEGIQYFDKTGMGLGDAIQTTKDGRFVAVTIKKSPKFFDAFKYTGNGSNNFNRQISHNLGVAPAMIWIRRHGSGNSPTYIWHKDMPNHHGNVDFEHSFKTANTKSSGYSALYGNEIFGGTLSSLGTPTEDYIVINGDWTNNQQTAASGSGMNVNNQIYEVYLFADQPTTGNIATGSYIGNGAGITYYPTMSGSNSVNHYGTSTTGVNIDLGWEPQFVMIKAMTISGEWIMLDTTRGWDRHEGNVLTLSRRNDNTVNHYFDREYTHTHGYVGFPHARGFEVRGTGTTSDYRSWSGQTQEWSRNWNKSGERYLYFAVRRPRKVPTAGNQVFSTARGSRDPQNTAAIYTHKGEYKDFVNNDKQVDQYTTGVQTNGKYMGTTAFKPHENNHLVPITFKPDVVILSNVNHPAEYACHHHIYTRLTGKMGHELGRLAANPQYPSNGINQLHSYNPFDGNGFGEIGTSDHLQSFYAQWALNPNPSGSFQQSGTNQSRAQNYAMMLQRAPGFMDVTVDKTGQFGLTGILGSPGDVITTKHNLGVVPEMIISKVFRPTISDQSGQGGSQHAPSATHPENRWLGFDVRHKDMTNGLNDRMMINAGWGAWDKAMNPHANATHNYGGYYADSSQSQSNTITTDDYGTVAHGSHTIGTVTASNTELVYTGVDGTAGNIATPGQQADFYVQRIMFATLAGVSKVGYYLGTGTTTVNVNCGFSGGARFILIKREDAAGNWYMFDAGNAGGYGTEGIATGNDTFTVLNQAHAHKTGVDVIDPYSQGFAVPANSYTDGSTQYSSSVAAAPININGARYIFLAIA